MTKYRIYVLSARAIMRNAKKNASGYYTYYLNEEATNKCIIPSAPETQDDCALFHQIIKVVDRDEKLSGDKVISDMAYVGIEC